MTKEEKQERIHEYIDKIEDWNKLSKTPLLTVTVATYNHEKYIKDCLDGILMQKTNFQYQIFVKEDFSTDKTRDIVIEYQKKHPDKIRLWLCKENLYSQGLKVKGHDFINSKYIAVCEGDDYWTDPLKLQKQVDFLEENEQINMCGHSTKIIGTNAVLEKKLKFERSHFLAHKEVVQKNPIHTSSFVYRNSVISEKRRPIKNPGGVGDYLVLLCGSEPNGIYIFKDVMSAYRVNNVNSVWMGKQDNTKRVNQMHITIQNMLDSKAFNKKTEQYLKQRLDGKVSKDVKYLIRKIKKNRFTKRWFK